MGDNKISSGFEERLVLLENKYSELQKQYSTLQGRLAESNEARRESVADKNTRERSDEKDNRKPNGEATENTPKSPIHRITSRIERESGERKDYPGGQDAQDTSAARRAEWSVTFRKIVLESGMTSGEIEIFDRNLRILLRELLPHYPYHFFLGETLMIPSPYEPLILNWDILDAESRKECADEEKKQVRLVLKELLEAILNGSGDTKLDSYMQTRASLRKQHSVTFEALWTVFPPGTVVYGRTFFREDQLFLVEDNLGPWPDEDRRPVRRASSDRLSWELKCWIYDFTGEWFERRSVTLSFEEFEGAKPIASLPFHPLEYNEHRVDIEQELLERGQLFRKYCTDTENGRMYEYNGQAKLDQKGFRGVYTDPSETGTDELILRELRGRSRESSRTAPAYLRIEKGDVMVDFESYRRYGRVVPQVGELTVEESTQECACRDCAENEELRECLKQAYDRKTGKGDEPWEDLQTMLCPPRVLGYILKDKQWGQLAVKDLSPKIPQEPMEVLKSLHLGDDEKERKELLLGLVKNHGLGEEGDDFKDIVPEKGKGLVVLLYGQPGVGKTSTAQMIAMATGKPLFPIGVADVGTDPRHVESNLETIFSLASTWKAILLIDEADVFLQSRSGGSFRGSAGRNGLVSVFLRVLEYYRGILFLTTNIIAQFDVAVQSRIHIALRYDELSKEQSKAIFMGFVDQYKKNGTVKARDYEGIAKYADNKLYKVKEKFDGRQIRNIVTGAVGFARGIGEDTLNVRHIQHVAENIHEFKTDLKGQMAEWKKNQDMAGV